MSADSPLQPPPAVRGMTELHRPAFSRCLRVPALQIPAQGGVSKLLKLLRPQLMRMPGIRPVLSSAEAAALAPSAPGHGDVSDATAGHGDVSDVAPGRGDVSDAAAGNGDVGDAAAGPGDISDAAASHEDVSDASRKKVALLDPGQVSGPADLPWPQLAEHGVYQRHFCRLPVRLTYENFTADAVLRAVIPADQPSVTGFSRIGHLIHLNLKDHTLPYGKLIGAVLMDKQKGVKCVVNKLNTIDNTFRNFSMDVLAGEADFIVEAKENGCTFRMDFSKVYWNPRLSTEHQRIVDMLAPADVVADVFAGIGPFTVPAAKNGHRVIANDLNPDSVQWLRHNVAANKVRGSVDVYNQDGREFIGGPLRAELRTLLERGGGGRLHAVCNLPALAIDFMDAFVGLLAEGELAADAAPPLRVHVHTFTKEAESAAEREVVASLSSRVGCDVSTEVKEVLMVRNVAPSKLMYRVSWDVPPHLLCSSTSAGPPLKKPRVGDAE